MSQSNRSIASLAAQAESFRQQVDALHQQIQQEIADLQSQIDMIRSKVVVDGESTVQLLRSKLLNPDTQNLFSFDMMNNQLARAQERINRIDAHVRDVKTNQIVNLDSIESQTEQIRSIVPLIEQSMLISTTTNDISFDPKTNQDKINQIESLLKQLNDQSKGKTVYQNLKIGTLDASKIRYFTKQQMSEPVPIFPAVISISDVFAEKNNMYDFMLGNDTNIVTERTVASTTRRNTQKVKQQKAQFSISTEFSLFITPSVWSKQYLNLSMYSLKEREDGSVEVANFNTSTWQESINNYYSFFATQDSKPEEGASKSLKAVGKRVLDNVFYNAPVKVKNLWKSGKKGVDNFGQFDLSAFDDAVSKTAPTKRLRNTAGATPPVVRPRPGAPTRRPRAKADTALKTNSRTFKEVFNDINRLSYKYRWYIRAVGVVGAIGLGTGLALTGDDTPAQFTIPYLESLMPRASLSRLTKLSIVDGEETLIDTFERISIAFKIDVNAYDAEKVYEGFIFNTSVKNSNVTANYFEYFTTGEQESDPLLAVQTSEIPLLNKLIKMRLFSQNGIRLLSFYTGPEAIKIFEVSTDATYYLTVNFSKRGNSTDYIIRVVQYNDFNANLPADQQTDTSSIQFTVTVEGNPAPLGVVFPDANNWGNPLAIETSENDRKIQLLDEKTNEPSTSLKNIFQLYDVKLTNVTKPPVVNTQVSSAQLQPMQSIAPSSFMAPEIEATTENGSKQIDQHTIKSRFGSFLADPDVDRSSVKVRPDPENPENQQIVTTSQENAQNSNTLGQDTKVRKDRYWQWKLLPKNRSILEQSYVTYENVISLVNNVNEPFFVGSDNVISSFFINFRDIALGDFKERTLFVIHNADNSIEYIRMRYSSEYGCIDLYDVHQRSVLYTFPAHDILVRVFLYNLSSSIEDQDYKLNSPHTLRMTFEFYTNKIKMISREVASITLQPTSVNVKQIGSRNCIIAIPRLVGYQPYDNYNPIYTLDNFPEREWDLNKNVSQTTQDVKPVLRNRYASNECIIYANTNASESFSQLDSQSALNYTNSLYKHITFDKVETSEFKLATIAQTPNTPSNTLVDNYFACRKAQNADAWTRLHPVSSQWNSLMFQHTTPEFAHADSFYIYPSTQTQVSYTETITLATQPNTTTMPFYFKGSLVRRHNKQRLVVTKSTHPNQPVLTAHWNEQTVIVFEHRFDTVNQQLLANLFVIDGQRHTIQGAKLSFQATSAPMIECLVQRTRMPSNISTIDEDEVFTAIEDSILVVAPAVETSTLGNAIALKRMDRAFPSLVKIDSNPWTIQSLIARTQTRSLNSNVSIQINRADLPASFNNMLKINVLNSGVSSVALVDIASIANNGVLTMNDTQYDLDSSFIEIIGSIANGTQSVEARLFTCMGQLLATKALFSQSTTNTLSWRLEIANVTQQIPLYANLWNISNAFSSTVVNSRTSKLLQRSFALSENFHKHSLVVVMQNEDNKLSATILPFETRFQPQQIKSFSVQICYRQDQSVPKHSLLVVRPFNNTFRMLVSTEDHVVVSQQGSLPNALFKTDKVLVRVNLVGTDMLAIQVCVQTSQSVFSYQAIVIPKYDIQNYVNVSYLIDESSSPIAIE